MRIRRLPAEIIQAFAIIGERKKIPIHKIILLRSDLTGSGSETLILFSNYRTMDLVLKYRGRQRKGKMRSAFQSEYSNSKKNKKAFSFVEESEAVGDMLT